MHDGQNCSTADSQVLEGSDENIDYYRQQEYRVVHVNCDPVEPQSLAFLAGLLVNLNQNYRMGRMRQRIGG